MILAEPIIEKVETLEDLMRANCKAELINGKVVRMMAVGYAPSSVAGNIYFLLRLFIKQSKAPGSVHSDGMGFAVPKLNKGRQSFSPDVSYYSGPPPKNVMRYIEGPPTFAVEVRSENDYGPATELDIAAKRADYFEAGTLVVWDVDIERKLIHCYKKSSPWSKETFQPGQIANAEPAVPGWVVKVDDIFRD